MPRLSLTARAFLFSFLPVCLVLFASFIALSAAIHERVKQELRESLQDSDTLMNRASKEYSRRTTRLLAKLTDSAGLKAAVGLLAEEHKDPLAMEQVRRTIEAQLRELQSSSTYDFIAVSDLRGRTVAAILSPELQELSSLPSVALQPGLKEIEHVLYQLEAVPITIQGEPAAVLAFGTRFDLDRLPLAGQAVLLHGDKVDRSTLPAKWNSAIEQQIVEHCGKPISGCEVTVDRETLIISQLDTAELGDTYRLFGVRSLDSRLNEFNAAFVRILVEVGTSGVLLALLSTLVTSYSVSQPLRGLVAQLERSELTGEMPEHLTVENGVRELDSLTNAFNHVAAAERRSRHELELAKDAAESSNRLKTEFLTNVSHELRTPLNGILGMTEVLAGTPLDEDQQEYATVVRESAQSLLALIDDVLDFSRLDAGKVELAFAPFNLGDLLTALTVDVRARAAPKGIQVEMFYSASAPQVLVGDVERVRQVLFQLADNAIKFTERGTIRIEGQCLAQTGGEATLRLAVADTGIGIAADKRDLIFQKFSQADGSLTRRHGGTGLGLAIVKEVIQLMHGQIGFESRVSAGSTFWFTFTLPLAEPMHSLQNAPVSSGGTRLC
jgi:signal transduction histidine kinase